MTRPSLRQIECLLAIRDAGGFSRAAERLGLSQPALSGQIRELESLLGLRLVDRTTRRVALTPAGEAFATRAAAGLAELDRAQAEAQGRAALSAGRLRLVAPPLLAAGLMPGVMADFARAHPGLALTLSDLPTDDIIARLRDGRADAGIGTFPPGLPDLDARPLFRDVLMLFAAPGHPLAGLSQVPWAALEGQALVALGRESGLRLLAEMGFERAGLALRPVQEVAQVATALALVAAGFGVAVLPGYARIAPQAAGLAVRPLDGAPIGRQIAALIPRDRSAPPALAPFLDAIARALRRPAPE
jgi:DNA-binding transcriptional LysR family regulator